jgi:ppGpp synthetase/RelA/SpoT-type nucleotidyltranferase
MMTSAERPEIPKADVETVLAEFDRKKDVLATLCETTRSLIEKCLRGDGIRFQYVQARVKNRDKLRAKYLDPQKNYRQLDDITDQAALRVITYYEDEVDLAAEVIKREFEIDSKHSVDKRDVDPEKFGYYALNYVCRYSDTRTKHIEYRGFERIPCEIQITSILRHAWSEIEHPWYDLKDAFPDNIKRRFARMAALLEIAESEFLSLRKIQSDYVLSVGVQVETNVPDVPVDPVSLRTFIEQDPLVLEIDTVLSSILGMPLADRLVDSAAEFAATVSIRAGMTKLQDVRDALGRYRTGIPEFVEQCRLELWPPSPAGSILARGVCIIHLASLLVGSRGTGETVELLRSRGIRNITFNASRQEVIAKEIVAKYPR